MTSWLGDRAAVDRPATVAGVEEACAAACQRNHVEWQSFVCDDPAFRGVLAGHGEGHLWVVSQRSSPTIRQTLMQPHGCDSRAALLVCPEKVTTVTRVLILNDARHPDGGYLQAAEAVCQQLAASPVVLTVAHSEPAAQRAAAVARAALEHSDLDILFDRLVGLGVRAAVGRIARWRRCQLVMMSQQAPSSWWQRLRGPNLPGLADSLPEIGFLSLPLAGVVSQADTGARDPTRDPSHAH